MNFNIFYQDIYIGHFLFIYLFRAANFMHNINIIHRSFFPTALPHRLPFLFLALPFFALACFLALPTSVPCLFPCPAFFLALPTSVPYLQIYFFYKCTLHGYIASVFYFSKNNVVIYFFNDTFICRGNFNESLCM